MKFLESSFIKRLIMGVSMNYPRKSYLPDFGAFGPKPKNVITLHSFKKAKSY